jgi:hypothetical protein
VKIIEKNIDSPSLVEKVGHFVASLARALKESGKDIES